MKSACALSVFLLIAAITPCVAQEANNGASLLQACTLNQKSFEIGYVPSPQEAMQAGYCMGYISGLLESEDNGTHFCTTHPYLVKPMVSTVVNYLKAHPEKLQDHRHSVSLQALSNAFSCAATKAK